ncbi:MAG: DUF2791 family P-loop domain-containing protein [Deltaproteobacteria bacterium]|nr:DUF2791 family P-loop domain-containing protein [Deltaproteobacteria bacterium]
MSQLNAIDTAELTSWLTRVTQTIDRSLREPARSEAIDALRDGIAQAKVALPVLAQLALLDDCLRVAHLALEADGLIEEEELARITDLVRVATPKYFAVLPGYEAFGDAIGTHDIERFLRQHRADAGPYGYASKDPWRGLALARRIERVTRNASPLREHERMLARIMDEVFAERATDVERSARRRLRELFEQPSPAPGVDPRAVAFCRADGPEVFTAVAHSSQLFLRDPYDVESLHAEARMVLNRQIERATEPAHQEQGHGRMLLVLGEAGSGKTHLLRALRTQVHAQRLGYVGYMQMSADVGDHARFMLRSLVDSLERPYDAPGLPESALMYLSDGVAEGRAPIALDDLEELRSAELSPVQLDRVIGRCIDQIVRTEGLGGLESDLLHALLLLQRRDPALQRRVVRFLRCESLGAYDRELLGGLAPRDQPQDPLRTIQQLARIMYELHYTALVLVVDQLEDTIPNRSQVGRMQEAFNNLRTIADAVPSAVIVISCLGDVYESIKGQLQGALRDRIEHDPPPIRLSSACEVADIEQMLALRLEHLYSAFDVAWREDDPFYPFHTSQVEEVAKLRPRECLRRFREYHASCVAARGLVPVAGGERPEADAPFDAAFDATWRSHVAAVAELPADDDGILALLEEGARAALGEAGVQATLRRDGAGRLVVERADLPARCVGVCNGRGQGGHLGRQLAQLRASVAKTAAPVALRSSDWKMPAKSATGERVGEFRASGGITIFVQENELREIVAARALTKTSPPGLAAWRRVRTPLARLACLRELLDLDRVVTEPTEPPAPPTPPPTPPPPTDGPVTNPRASGPIPVFDPATVRLGALTTIRAEPVVLALDVIKKHVAYLGSPGSGKTTVALSVTEQLLERGVSVLLVDRKGDLARYASSAWWDEPGPDPARKASLRRRVKVSLFTPGNPTGRPLRLPLIPSMRDAVGHERETIARYAASGLATMMGYGRSARDAAKEAVLKRAIELLADEPEITLDLLYATVSRPDPQLLQAIEMLDKHIAPVAENLQTLKIQKGSLLSGEGEALDLAELLPPPCDHPRLTIISTAAFAEVPVQQFWVSRLLADLARLARKRPAPTLQAAAFFDEADAYIPAVGAPPTKEPMFDLLRRARAAGIGIMLATQNPGDIDYKGRDNIATWLVGKVAQDTAIAKMRNLLSTYPNVAVRLASQSTGAFFVLSEGPAKEIRADRALMDTHQLSEHEVADRARRGSS